LENLQLEYEISIKVKVKNNPNIKVTAGTVVFDEIKILETLVFNKKTLWDKILGVFKK
jgi:hypothetical protein